MLPGDPDVDRIVTIAADGGGQVVATVRYHRSPEATRVLSRAPSGVCRNVDSTFGDRYRIVPHAGDLQLRDNARPMRPATRLDDTLARGECAD